MTHFSLLVAVVTTHGVERVKISSKITWGHQSEVWSKRSWCSETVTLLYLVIFFLCNFFMSIAAWLLLSIFYLQLFFFPRYQGCLLIFFCHYLQLDFFSSFIFFSYSKQNAQFSCKLYEIKHKSCAIAVQFTWTNF